MADPIETPLDQGVIARVVAGVRYAVTGKTPTAWFGPGEPLQPVAQEVAGRAFDYPVYTNLQIQPRATENINFATLRAFGDGCDLVRLAIETRKDQMANLAWAIQPKDKKIVKGEKAAALEAFFAFPDKQNNWSTWLRMLLEELMVTDAPTLYVQLTKGKQPYAFLPIDGATIKPLITSDGRRPMAPDAAYVQSLKGVPAVHYSADEMLYMARNVRTHKIYGFSPVEQIIQTIIIQIRKVLFQQEYYTEGSIPDAIVGTPKEWNPKSVKEFQDLWDSTLSGNTANRRRAKFVPDGINVTLLKTAALKDEFDEWLARIICFAFSLPPTAFVKEQNRATAETAREAALTEGLLPLMLWVKNWIDLILVKYFGVTDHEFVWADAKEQDALAQAQIDQIYLQTGVLDVNEVRSRLGLEAKEEPAAGASQEPPAKEQQQSSSEPDTKLSKKKARLTPINRDRPAVLKAIAAMKGGLTEFFGKEKKRLIGDIITAYEERTKADDEDEDIADSLDLDSFTAIVGVVKKPLGDIAEDGALEGLQQIGIDDGDIIDAVAEKAAGIGNYRAAELVGKQWRNGKLVDNPSAKWRIDESTRELLRADINTAMEEGWSTDRLASVLADNYAFSDARADTIARTEIARADLAGSMESYRESGVVEGKEWLLAGDPCDECQENADQGVIGLDDVFKSGDDAAPAHPNCRCDVSPRLKEED
jgi:HK97 family phage portal protein